MRSVLRAPVRVLLFATIGAAATVFIAWGLTLWPMEHPARASSQQLAWPRPVPPEWPERPTYANVTRRFGFRADSAGHSESSSPAPDRSWSASVYCAGWPLLAMRREERWHSAGGPSIRAAGGLVVPAWLHDVDEWGFNLRLPLTPEWPGFLVDTAFWGGAAFVVWSVPGFVRRGARRRRGRCVGCGYELKGLAVCPECGGAA